MNSAEEEVRTKNSGEEEAIHEQTITFLSMQRERERARERENERERKKSEREREKEERERRERVYYISINLYPMKRHLKSITAY